MGTQTTVPPSPPTDQRDIDSAIAQEQARAPRGLTQPLLDFPPYASTRLRHPSRELRHVDPEGAEWVGPVFGDADVDPADGDLTQHGDSDPIGERILVRGRILDGDGRPVRHQLVEIWQANAAATHTRAIGIPRLSIRTSPAREDVSPTVRAGTSSRPSALAHTRGRTT